MNASWIDRASSCMMRSLVDARLWGAVIVIAIACGQRQAPEGQGGETTTECCESDSESGCSCGAGPPGAGAGEPCYFDNVGEFEVEPALPALAGQGVCTSDEILDVVDCLRFAADAETCMSAFATDTPCLRCLGFSIDGAPFTTLPVIGYNPELEVSFVNTGACEALAQDIPDCAQPAAELQFSWVTICEIACHSSEIGGWLSPGRPRRRVRRSVTAGRLLDSVSQPRNRIPVVRGGRLRRHGRGGRPVLLRGGALRSGRRMRA